MCGVNSIIGETFVQPIHGLNVLSVQLMSLCSATARLRERLGQRAHAERARQVRAGFEIVADLADQVAEATLRPFAVGLQIVVELVLEAHAGHAAVDLHGSLRHEGSLFDAGI